MIEFLKWDSDFFGKKIGRIDWTTSEIISYHDLDKDNYDMIYIFSSHPLKINVALMDVKVTFSKSVNYYKPHSEIAIFDKKKHSYSSLLKLAYLSGHDSRFLKDSFFGEQAYKKMYKQWLDNAISNESILVFVAILNNSIQGFVTVHQQAIHSTIGLIAVSKEVQLSLIHI